MQNKFFIVSIDNQVDKNTVHTTDISLDLFVLSARKKDLEIKYISNDKKELDFFATRSSMPMLLAKIHAQKKFIFSNIFSDQDLILFVDSYDLIFNGKINDFVDVFRYYNTGILIGAEKTGWPEENKIFSRDSEMGKNRYPNTGCILGTYKSFKKVFEENQIDSETNDQIFWGKMYKKYKTEGLIKIDHLSKLVQNDLYDFMDDNFYSGLILHANGYSRSISKRDCLKRVYRKIYGSIDSGLGIPVFLINLIDRSDRLVNSLRVWGKFGIYPHVVKAVESFEVNSIMAKKYANTSLDKVYKPDSWRRSKKQKDVMCAISFSHIKAFEYAKDLNLDKVIIAQDDLIIHKDFVNVVNSFDKVNYEAVQFECCHTDQHVNIEEFKRWPYHALLTQDCYFSGTVLESAILHTKESLNYFLEEDLKMQKNIQEFDITETLSFRRQFVSKKWYTHFPFSVLQKNEDSDQFLEFNPEHLASLRETTNFYLSFYKEDYYS